MLTKLSMPFSDLESEAGLDLVSTWMGDWNTKCYKLGLAVGLWSNPWATYYNLKLSVR